VIHLARLPRWGGSLGRCDSRCERGDSPRYRYHSLSRNESRDLFRYFIRYGSFHFTPDFSRSETRCLCRYGSRNRSGYLCRRLCRCDYRNGFRNLSRRDARYMYRDSFCQMPRNNPRSFLRADIPRRLPDNWTLVTGTWQLGHTEDRYNRQPRQGRQDRRPSLQTAACQLQTRGIRSPRRLTAASGLLC